MPAGAPGAPWCPTELRSTPDPGTSRAAPVRRPPGTTMKPHHMHRLWRALRVELVTERSGSPTPSHEDVLGDRGGGHVRVGGVAVLLAGGDGAHHGREPLPARHQGALGAAR